MQRLRVAAAGLILIALVVLGVRLLPVYLENMRLQSYVEEVAQDASTQIRADDLLRVAILDRAANLGLPVKAQDVQIKRSSDRVRIDVKYIVRVDLPLYTVDLHFYPGAGSR